MEAAHQQKKVSRRTDQPEGTTIMPRILLVEDNPENRDMLSRRLERRGYEILLAIDGQQAIEQAQQQQPDLILMDIGLPGMDGCQATQRIRGMPKICRTPIIALTAHAMQGDRQWLLSAGCDDYHSKPVELPRLLEQIRALLSGGTSATDQPLSDPP